MIDIKLIRENPRKVKAGARKKGFEIDIDFILKLDKRKREIQTKLEKLRHRQRILSLKKPLPLKKLRGIKNEIKKLEKIKQKLKKELEKKLLQIPNLPLDEVPVGKDEKGNIVLKEVGEKPRFTFKPKDYLEIAKNLDLVDIERASKISGTRFGFLKNEAVLLEFALINFTYRSLIKKGFSPIIPPVMIKPEMAKGMGYPEQFDGEEAYFIEKDNLFLVGTSEQSIGSMHAGEVFEEKDLPKNYLGFSTCFRREAGSWGKETWGIFRVHQFDKIEMFSFCTPETSKKINQFFLKIEEKLMQLLKIPYRVVQVCTGDLGFPTAAKYDIEAWIPSRNKYLETHSTSSCTDFQARRLNIRYRKKSGKLDFVHTVNGTAFAIGRILIAILENYQTFDGKVKVPEVLKKDVGKEIIG